jgi:hypothetical protein
MFIGGTPRSERGQGSLESVGIVVLAAILATSIVGVIVQASPNLRDNVAYQLCRIVHVVDGGDCEKPGDLRTADERVPDEPCVSGSQSVSAEATASVVVTVKRGYSFLIERMSDGTYKVTRVDTLGVGTGVGPGIDISLTLDGKKYGVTAIASADAMLAGKMGETWYADSEDGANDIIKDIIANDVVDEVVPDVGVGPFSAPNPVKWAIKKLIGEPGDPDEEFGEGGIEGSAEATVSGITAGAGASVKAENYLGGKKTPDGYTAYFRTAISGSAWANVLNADATNYDGASAMAGGEMLAELNFDKSGKTTSIKMTTTVTLDAATQDGVAETDDQKVTEYSFEVPLTGDPVHDAPLYAALASPVALPGYIDEARKNGYATQNVYSQDPNTYGLNVGGELLGEYGGSVSGDVTNKDLQEALYWDGEKMAPRPDC